MAKALVVDDSRAVRMILAKTLKELGFEVREAANGREALEVIESTLRAAADPPAGEYLDADVGSCALAAAEIVAGALDRPASGLPEDVTVWLQTHGKAVPASFRPLAEAAVARAAASREASVAQLV